MRNLALERDLVEVVGEHGAQAVAIDTAARHVLGTSEIAALNDQDRLAGLAISYAATEPAQPEPTTIASKSAIDSSFP